MIGLESHSSLEAEAQVALGSVIPLQRQPPINQTFENLSDRLRKTSACTISFVSDGSEKNRLALHIRSGLTRRVVLAIDRETPIVFLIANGAIIYDGKVVMDQGQLHVLKLMALTYSRSFASQGYSNPDLSRLATGQFLITPAGFENHLIPTSGLSFASQAVDLQCCNKAVQATVKVGVSATGDVVFVVPVRVPAESSAKVTKLLSTIKLKPFIVNRNPVEAEGYVSLLIEPSGRISLFY